MIYTITLNPAIDRLLFLDKKMETRKTNRITEVAYDIGGKGTHGSYTMTKLGVENVALGFMGSVNANKFQRVLDSKGITNGFTMVEGQTTRECYIVVDTDYSGTTMLTEKGLEVSRKEVNVLFSNLENRVERGDIVLIAGSLPAGFTLEDLEEMITFLKSRECFVACDLSGDALKTAVNIGVDFIKPNEFELDELNERKIESIEFLKQLNEKIKYIVASLGENGSYCIYETEVYRAVPPSVDEVNDTGAGDCFVGAFISGLSKQMSIEDTLKLASACAASKVTHNDSSTFDLEEVQHLKEQTQILQNQEVYDALSKRT